ncbi:MAG: SIMPL domain-containing protein [Myxococcales bacterium]|nr:SIMPL domain-containing protein [Myxococcales bacterium]
MYASQSIQRPVGLNVFGSCLLGAEPDYASIRCTVSHTAETPAPAFEGTRARLTAVRQAFSKGGVAGRDLQVSRIGLKQAYEGPYNERRFVGYEGSAELTVITRDLPGMEALLQAVVEAGALLQDVGYKTSALVELRARARAGAVEAARRKAEAYAAAASARVGPLLHLEDIDPDKLGQRSHAPDVDLVSNSDPQTITGSIRVAGAVMACFGILHG